MKRLERKGSALIAAVVALSVLVCIGGMVARLMKTEIDSTINFRDGISAQYVAEAGLRRALVVLYKNGNLDVLTENMVHGTFSGSYRVVASAEGVNLRVSSAGKVGNAGRTASVLVHMAVEPTPGEPLMELTILSWGN
jgi:type II secretory pathway component PulK